MRGTLVFFRNMLQRYLYISQGERKDRVMSEYYNVADIFGENVFNDAVMQERLPKKVYKKMKEIIEKGAELDPATADVVAHEQSKRAPRILPTGSSR